MELLPNGTNSYAIIENGQGNSTIIFFTVAKSHRGKYTCNASHIFSSAKVSFIWNIRWVSLWCNWHLNEWALLNVVQNLLPIMSADFYFGMMR